MNSIRTRERGAVLVIALIMLVLLTMLVLSVINMSSINLRVAGNNQARNESIAAAQQAIESVISYDFTTLPQASTVAVDINGDGTPDYSVAVDKPVCQNSIPIKSDELVVETADDASCLTTGKYGGPGASGDSSCAKTQWDIRSTVSDTSATGTGAILSVRQGVGVRVFVGTKC